jgi:hypothetical protein
LGLSQVCRSGESDHLEADYTEGTVNTETMASLVLPVEKIRERLNRDPEFLLAARFWYCDIRFFIGDDAYFMRIENGKVDRFQHGTQSGGRSRSSTTGSRPRSIMGSRSAAISNRPTRITMQSAGSTRLCARQ